VRIFIWLLFITAIFINWATLKNGHNWGDDFAQYIINARNIIEHKPYTSGVMLDNDVIYPPGLPLLLAPVLKVFGLSFRVLKILNIFSWFLAIILVYDLFLRFKYRRLALMVVVFLAFSSLFFTYKQNVLSDIPFFLFVCFSFYTFERWRSDDPAKQGSLFFTGFLLSMTAALWLRSAGITLFASALFYFTFVGRDKRAWSAVLLVFIINELLLYPWMGWHTGFWGSIPHEFLRNIANNFSTVFRSLWFFFCPAQTVFSDRLYDILDPVASLAAPLLYLLMVWSFIDGIRKRDLSYLECFSFFYISLLILWSGITVPPDAFSRFVFPLVPFIFIGSKRLLDVLRRYKLDLLPLARVVFLVLLLINLSNLIIIWNFNDDVFNVPENAELVSWVKHHMAPQEHFMFSKPRALALLTERTGMPPWIFPDQQRYFIQRVKVFKITYVIAVKDNDPRGLAAMLEKNDQFRLVWKNKSYDIFKFISPALMP